MLAVLSPHPERREQRSEHGLNKGREGLPNYLTPVPVISASLAATPVRIPAQACRGLFLLMSG